MQKLKCPNQEHDKFVKVICLNQNCNYFRLSCIKCTQEEKHPHQKDLIEIESLNDQLEIFTFNLKKQIDNVNETQKEITKLFDKYTIQLKQQIIILQEAKSSQNSQQINDIIQQMIDFQKKESGQFQQIEKFKNLQIDQTQQLVEDLFESINLHHNIDVTQTNNSYEQLISNINNQSEIKSEKPQQEQQNQQQNKDDKSQKVNEQKVEKQDQKQSIEVQQGQQLGQRQNQEKKEEVIQPKQLDQKLSQIFNIPPSSLIKQNQQQTNVNIQEKPQPQISNEQKTFQAVHNIKQNDQQQKCNNQNDEESLILEYVYQDLGNFLGTLIDILETYKYFENRNEKIYITFAINRLVMQTNFSNGIHSSCYSQYKDSKYNALYEKEKQNARRIFDEFYYQLDMIENEKISECINLFRSNLSQKTEIRQIQGIKIENQELNKQLASELFNSQENKFIQQNNNQQNHQIQKEDFNGLVKQRRERIRNILKEKFPNKQ